MSKHFSLNLDINIHRKDKMSKYKIPGDIEKTYCAELLDLNKNIMK